MRNKYNASKIVTEYGVFDSRKEYRRFLALREMEENGEIKDLRTQVKYELISAKREPDTVGARGGIKKGKIIEKSCDYFADFVYIKDGETIVEDVKGYRKGGAYAVFTIKRKLMLDRYGLKVYEV